MSVEVSVRSGHGQCECLCGMYWTNYLDSRLDLNRQNASQSTDEGQFRRTDILVVEGGASSSRSRAYTALILVYLTMRHLRRNADGL